MAENKPRYMVALDVNRYNPDDPAFDTLIAALEHARKVSIAAMFTHPSRAKWFIITILHSGQGEPFEPIAAVINGHTLISQELIDQNDE